MKRVLKLLTIVIATLTFIVTSSNVPFVKNVHAADRVYSVPVELWHAENSGRLSMGNNALATHATVNVHDNNTSTISVQFTPMDFSNMHGHLLSLSIYSSPIFSGSLTAASVTSTYNDTNLDGGTSTYPGTLSFNFGEAKPDKVGVRVAVDAMNQIMGGDASQNAIIKFNWSAANLVSGSEDSSKDKEKKAEDKKKEEDNKDKKDENKAPEGFVAKKLEDYFKDDQKTKNWSKAMLQRTKDGKLYATVRIHLMNWVQRSKEQGPFIKVLQKDGEFKQVEATETKVNIEQYKDSYVDYRFEVPNENFLAMVQMYVEPMNRPVRYFVEVNTDTIKNGNDGLDMEAIKETNYTPYYLGGIGVLAIAAGLYFPRKKRKNRR